MRYAIVAVVIVLALAACKAKTEMPTQPFTKAGVTMKLDPPAAPSCKPGTRYRATLTWTVDASSPKTDVRINGPEGQLFARSNDRSYHAETGDWVTPGLWFILSDRRSGEVLGAIQAGPKPCP